MTFEMMLYFNDYDEVIVFTGDGDYFWVLEYLKEKKPIRLFGCGRSIARELKHLLGGRVTDINLIREIVSLKNKDGTDAFEESAPWGYGSNLTHNNKKVKR